MVGATPTDSVMLITKSIEIDMGHRVPNHKSKCRNCHGHRYKIEVGVDDKIISKKGASNEGMVIDFGDLKEIMMKEIDARFDHGFVIYKFEKLANYFVEMVAYEEMKVEFVSFIPTAENLAKHWFEILQPELKKKKIKLSFVKVWETPTSTAIYEQH